MSSLQDFGDAGPQVHGLSPMASACRRISASRNVAKRNFTTNSIVSGQNDLAIGREPMVRHDTTRSRSPNGTT